MAAADIKAKYEGKSALVTGGSSGIGLAIAVELARAGANVWIMARTPERLADALIVLEQSRRSAKQIFASIPADVSRAEEVDAAIVNLQEKYGVPDLLFNSAGFCQPGYLETVSHTVYQETMAVNFFGMLNVTQALLPGMIARASGHIVNICSILGFVGLYGYAPYNASKYAVRGFTDTLRMEMKPRGIKVSLVFPGDTDTPQLHYEKKFRTPETNGIEEVLGVTKPMPPETAAKIILRETAKGKYQIFLDSSGLWMYRLQSLAMGLTYPALDFLLGKAKQRLAKNRLDQH